MFNIIKKCVDPQIKMWKTNVIPSPNVESADEVI